MINLEFDLLPLFNDPVSIFVLLNIQDKHYLCNDISIVCGEKGRVALCFSSAVCLSNLTEQ